MVIFSLGRSLVGFSDLRCSHEVQRSQNLLPGRKFLMGLDIMLRYGMGPYDHVHPVPGLDELIEIA